jgi:hypothetical protein
MTSNKDLGNFGPIVAIGQAHAAANDALTDAESVIRSMCQQGDTHRAFLNEFGMHCRFDQPSGIQHALTQYRNNLPATWFGTKGRPESALVLGFRLINAQAQNIMWRIIAEELGEDFGDQWLFENGGWTVPENQTRALFTEEGVHNDLLTEIGVRSEVGDEAGIRRALEANRAHFPAWWFGADGQPLETIIQGLTASGNAHSYIWAIIAGELGTDFGNAWFAAHFDEIRALFSNEEWAEAAAFARETFGYEAGSN